MRKMTRIFLAAGLLLSFKVIAMAEDTSGVLWLDEMDLSKAAAEGCKIVKNKSVGGNPLTINGKTFERGVGTEAESRINIRLHKAGRAFEALVGVDSEVCSSEEGKKSARVNFIIYGDGRELWRSGNMRGEGSAKEVKTDLTGIEVLSLSATGSLEIGYGSGDWAQARITYQGVMPEIMAPLISKPYILTPKPGLAPRITGPKIFGVRPGNPFLFTLTATGAKPVNFKVRGLPKGLKLNPANGQIRGVVKKAGQYKTTVIAQNKHGRAEREFTIAAGEAICLTPPMGWNSWNCWACEISDEKVRASAKAMVDSGLIDHGWSYINIDDCWMRKAGAEDAAIGGPVRDKDGYLLSNAKFPDMKALTDYVHSLGLRVGLYISPGPTTCQGYVGSWEHEQKDAERFAEWGFDYLKYDWCGYRDIVPKPSPDEMKRPYLLMREKLDNVPRDIVYSLCQYGMGKVWEWGAEAGGNCWRTTGDIFDTWASMTRIGFKQAELYPYAGPGRWNDPDMLVVGQVGWGAKLHPTRLSPDEQYTHISLWSLLSSPLLIGCPIEQLDEFTYSLLTNDEVLDVNQDPLGRQGQRISDTGDMQVWFKELQDGSRAAGLFNVGEMAGEKVTIRWKDIGLAGACRVRDLWRQKDRGVFKDSFTAEVPAHGVVLIQIFPAKHGLE